jgi:2-oxoglutarate ferredoxin oxidoreductase subunit delta
VSETAKKRKVQKNWGQVRVETDRCKGCGFCVAFCPSDALELSREFNAKGYHPPLLVDQNFCSGCDLCGLFCPDFAIYGWMIGPNPNYKPPPRAAP